MIFKKLYKNRMFLFIPFGLVGMLIVIFSILIYINIQKQKFDGVRINLAGRQRMLTQKLTKEILLSHNVMVLKKNIKDTIDIFESTLYSLTFGGDAPMDLDKKSFRNLPESKNPKEKAMLLQIIESWEPFKLNVIKYIKSKDRESLDYIINNNEILLEKMNKIVFIMQETNETNNNNIKLLVSSEVFFIIIILSVFLFKRILDLRRASSRIDDLEKILPICSNCKKIRINDDAPKDINSWVTVEQYYHEKDETSFTHGICPECVKKLYPDVYKKIK